MRHWAGVLEDYFLSIFRSLYALGYYDAQGIVGMKSDKNNRRPGRLFLVDFQIFVCARVP